MAGRHRSSSKARRRDSHGGRHRRPPARARWIAPTLVAATVVSAGGVATAAVLGSDPSGHPADHPAVRSLRTVTVPAFVPDQSTAPAAVAPGTRVLGLHVRKLPVFEVTTTGRTAWVQVVGPGGHVLYAGLLRHGRHLGYFQHPLRVTVGDAGAVRITQRGHVRAAGRRGRVLQLTVR